MDDVCFFFNDTATTEIYTLSLHDALPICRRPSPAIGAATIGGGTGRRITGGGATTGTGVSFKFFGEAAPSASGDRKSTRLNSSHANISYAVFCLKKKKKIKITITYYR